jgi:hypothetical protein
VPERPTDESRSIIAIQQVIREIRMATRTRACQKCGAEIPAEDSVPIYVLTKTFGDDAGPDGWRAWYERRTVCPDCAWQQRKHIATNNLRLWVIFVALVLMIIAQHFITGR